MIPPDVSAALTTLGFGAYLPQLAAILIMGTKVVATAAFLAAILPRTTNASPLWWRVARAVLDATAFNFGRARNAPAIPAPEV